MTRNRWHILCEGETLTVTRALPVRLDVSAQTVLPTGSRLRLAQQVRQDLWRRMQGLRGFRPVVRVTRHGETCHVLAGGRVEGRFSRPHAETEISDMLSDPDLRARWSAYAAHREVARAS
ncbi:hypothetical protein [Shimia sp.]|uniref:hypothetical protein n=1 Tax=Shimia sp. TaxID=1954381 RepID=UPI0035634C82